ATSTLGVRDGREAMAPAGVSDALGQACSAASTLVMRGKPSPARNAATGKGPLRPADPPGGGTAPSPPLSSTETTPLITATSGKPLPLKLSTAKVKTGGGT